MYTSPSPLPRRAPLRLPFSVHIRKLFFLFSQLRSLHHPPLIPHLSHRRSVLAPRRGRRPRRPASFFFHAYGGDISRSGATSFCPRRQKDAKTPPKTHGLWNSFRPLAITAQKGPTTNRLYFYPRCRSRAPRENFLLSRRTGEVLYILHTFIFCGPKGRTYLSQPAGKRHPFPRPAFERPQWEHPAHTYLAMSPVAHPP